MGSIETLRWSRVGAHEKYLKAEAEKERAARGAHVDDRALELTVEAFLDEEPLRVFAIAYRFGFEAETRLAARHTLRQPIFGPFVKELEHIPASCTTSSFSTTAIAALPVLAHSRLLVVPRVRLALGVVPVRRLHPPLTLVAFGRREHLRGECLVHRVCGAEDEDAEGELDPDMMLAEDENEVDEVAEDVGEDDVDPAFDEKPSDWDPF
ncbi:hypothetical protein BU15DRAFT_75774 [Melanogaster broomeanus]|nr:hypothetical protein BU15DRAFT_75774 [Melanogaster broomeanus]